MRSTFLRSPRARYAVIVGLALAAALMFALSVALADPARPNTTARGQAHTTDKRPPAMTASARPAARPLAPSSASITGHLLAKGTPVTDTIVALREYGGGAQETEVMTTTTNSQGVYPFSNVDAPPAGRLYYVRYLNPRDTNGLPTNPNYVRIWFGPDLEFDGTMPISGGDLDIANVPLLTPPDRVQARLPITFTWQPRNVPSDANYPVIENPNPPYDGCIYGPSENNASYTLTSLAPVGTCTGFAYKKVYDWYVEIDDTTVSTSYSYGYSFETRRITFIEFWTAYLPLIIREAALPIATPRAR